MITCASGYYDSGNERRISVTVHRRGAVCDAHAAVCISRWGFCAGRLGGGIKGGFAESPSCLGHRVPSTNPLSLSLRAIRRDMEIMRRIIISYRIRCNRFDTLPRELARYLSKRFLRVPRILASVSHWGRFFTARRVQNVQWNRPLGF